MCTVSYFPISSNEFTLTSNRDVSKARMIATLPEKRTIYDRDFLAPIDKDANGTWIFTTPAGITACLLNGAFENHVANPPYRKSRGHIVLEILNFFSVQEFAEKVDLDAIEPFTLVLIESQNQLQSLYTLIWDGAQKHFEKLDATQPHIWASSTLYTQEQKAYVRKSYDKLVSGIEIENLEKELQSFHWCGIPKTNPEVIRIDNTTHHTVSTTQIVRQNEKVVMHYFDLIRNMESTLYLKNEFA